MYYAHKLSREAVRIILSVTLIIMAGPSFLSGEDSSLAMRNGEITRLIGEVSIKKAGEDVWAKAFSGLSVSLYDMLKAGAGSWADIEFSKANGQYFKLRLREQSQITFTNLSVDRSSSEEDIMVDLAIGDILIRTEKLNPKSKFVVRTPTSMIGVRGTSFEVRYKKEYE